ncbi:MAG: M56 family metallopeptidase [Ruthenibacterium sp.]
MTGILQAFLQISIPVSIIIAILAMMHPFLRKRYAAKWRYWAWLLLALRLLLPFHFDLPANAPIAPIQMQVPNRVIYTYTPPAVLPETQMTQPQTPNNVAPDSLVAPETPVQMPAPRQISLVSLAGIGWLLGFAVLLLWNVFTYALARRKLLRSAIPAADIASTLDFLRKQLGITRKIVAYETPLVEGPLLLGILKPCILLPDTTFSPQDSTMILCHELVHYKRHDIGYKMLLQLVCCVHWFNPLVWLMASLASRDIEISCDDAVLRGQNDVFRENYAGSIMQVLRRGYGKSLPCSTAFSDSKTTLKQRFINIFDANKKHNGIALLALLLAASVLATSLVACTVKELPAAENASAPILAAGETQITQAEIPAQAMELIRLYEEAANGYATPSVGWQFAQSDYFVYAYLAAYGDIEAYQQGDDADRYYTMPTALLQAGARLLYDGRMTAPDENFPQGNYIARTPKNLITLTLKKGIQNADGALQLTFARTIHEARPLADVTYTLTPFTADIVPPELAKKFAVGDRIYRLTTVVNAPPAALNTDVKTVEIGTVDALLAFAKDYNEHGYAYVGNTYLLTADLDLTGIAFPPIGQNLRVFNFYDPRDASEDGFNSLFDGQGHTITGLTLDIQAAESDDISGTAGFFSQIGKDGTVQNLTIKQANIKSTGTGAGILAGANAGSIKNCHVQGSVNGFAIVGGLVGQSRSTMRDLPDTEEGLAVYRDNTIENCTVDAEVAGTNEVGAFCGSTYGSIIKDCSAVGTVTGFQKNQEGLSFAMPFMTGGFAGAGFFTDFIRCSVDVPLIIKANGSWIGAFAGSMYKGSCQSCTYNPAVSGNWERIDVIDDVNATDYTNYDIKPVV